MDVLGTYKPIAYQTGNEYVLEVTPSSGVDASGSPLTSRQRAVAGLDEAPKYTGKPMTFNFQDVPVRPVLQLIAEETGPNLVASDSVTGKVPLRLVNVPWAQGLTLRHPAPCPDKPRTSP